VHYASLYIAKCTVKAKKEKSEEIITDDLVSITSVTGT